MTENDAGVCQGIVNEVGVGRIVFDQEYHKALEHLEVRCGD
jgi:hypothetical protein